MRLKVEVKSPSVRCAPSWTLLQNKVYYVAKWSFDIPPPLSTFHVVYGCPPKSLPTEMDDSPREIDLNKKYSPIGHSYL